MRNTLVWTLLVSSVLTSGPAFAQTMGQMQMSPAQPPAQQTTPSTQPDAQQPMQMDHSQMDHAQPGEAAQNDMSHDMSEMTGALGMYPSGREASGTSWQPDASSHMGEMGMHGSWMVMTHAMLNGVYDWQGGDHGDEKAFFSGMLMGMARRDLPSGDTIQLRAMLSPDPFMGASGYPLLLASGETANGIDHLVDRQHPHDLFMELSASYAHNISEHDSIFVYGGLPGEPAFGPPAFMHRMSAMDSPEAPITHHWLDSTHITFGVLTAGFVHDNWKIEVSRFRGREPDQHRFDIETGALDSTAVRLSWNPTQRLALQISWADQQSPEQLEPDVNETRWSASAIYTQPVGDNGWWSTTLAYGIKDPSNVESQLAWALESAYHPSQDLTFFGRAEQIETTELAPGPARTVAKVSLGAIRDFEIAPRITFGIGALYSHNFLPDALEPSYGGDPNGAMGFVRLKFNG
ncbi:MAG TPA: hypothetical protein VG841_07905 [Caulobacterales bacterium]|nr:hypothetical protein [Caulobacterales bacterium]